MSISPILKQISEGLSVCKVISGTYNPAVAGDRVAVAHGLTYLGEAVIPSIVEVVTLCADADGALTAGHVQHCKVDNTNVTIRGTATGLGYKILVAM